MNKGKYVVHAICTANSCRSRIAQGIIQDMAGNSGLEDKLESRSSGIQVDAIKAWDADNQLSMKLILKVLKVAYDNGVHSMTEYKGLIEKVLADSEKATKKHDKDEIYRAELNTAAGKVYNLVEEFDKASTIAVMAENGLIYPGGEQRQFVKDKSNLYVPMEEKHVEKVKEKVEDPKRVIGFDEFTPGMKLKGSLDAINYSRGNLDIKGFREIYNQIEKGCYNLVGEVKGQLK